MLLIANIYVYFDIYIYIYVYICIYIYIAKYIFIFAGQLTDQSYWIIGTVPISTSHKAL